MPPGALQLLEQGVRRMELVVIMKSTLKVSPYRDMLEKKADGVRRSMSAQKAAQVVARLDVPSDEGDLSQQHHEEWIFLNRNTIDMKLLREVSDALIAHQRTRESRVAQERLVSALQDRKRLAYVRYQGGVDTQLNALDADRDLFQAELTLAQIRYAELVSVVQLYKALGGGWA